MVVANGGHLHATERRLQVLLQVALVLGDGHGLEGESAVVMHPQLREVGEGNRFGDDQLPAAGLDDELIVKRLRLLPTLAARYPASLAVYVDDGVMVAVPLDD
jgi:hypothetical protein